MPGRLQCTLVTFACFLLVSHVCFAMTCHDCRLFVCISVCHAANDPETYNGGLIPSTIAVCGMLWRCENKQLVVSACVGPSV